MSGVIASALPATPRWRGLPSWVVVALSSCALLVVWELCCRVMDIPTFILPPPSAVALRMVEDLRTGLILPHLWTTFIEVIAGVAIASVGGVLLGTALALIPVLERTVYPLVLAFQTIPKVAIAPLLIIWCGFGIQSKIVTAAVIAIFPVLVNVMAGLKTVDQRRLLLMRALGASPLQTYLKVRLPGMLPYLFAGLEVCVVFAVIGAIVGEFIGASQGLGSLIIQRQSAVDVTGVFSVLAYLSAMGILMSVALRMIAARFAFWSVDRGSNGA